MTVDIKIEPINLEDIIPKTQQWISLLASDERTQHLLPEAAMARIRLEYPENRSTNRSMNSIMGIDTSVHLPAEELRSQIRERIQAVRTRLDEIERALEADAIDLASDDIAQLASS